MEKALGTPDISTEASDGGPSPTSPPIAKEPHSHMILAPRDAIGGLDEVGSQEIKQESPKKGAIQEVLKDSPEDVAGSATPLEESKLDPNLSTEVTATEEPGQTDESDHNKASPLAQDPNETVSDPSKSKDPVTPSNPSKTSFAADKCGQSVRDHEAILVDPDHPGQYLIRFRIECAGAKVFEQIDSLPKYDRNVPLVSDPAEVKYFMEPQATKIPVLSFKEVHQWVWNEAKGVYTKKGKEWKPKFVLRKFRADSGEYIEQYPWGGTLRKFADNDHAGGFDINNRAHVAAYNSWQNQVRSRNDSNYDKRPTRNIWHADEMRALREHVRNRIRKENMIEAFANPMLDDAVKAVHAARLKHFPDAVPRTPNAVASQMDRDRYDDRKKKGPNKQPHQPITAMLDRPMGIGELKELSEHLLEMRKSGEDLPNKDLWPPEPLSLDVEQKVAGGRSHLARYRKRRCADSEEDRRANAEAVERAAEALGLTENLERVVLPHFIQEFDDEVDSALESSSVLEGSDAHVSPGKRKADAVEAAEYFVKRAKTFSEDEEEDE